MPALNNLIDSVFLMNASITSCNKLRIYEGFTKLNTICVADHLFGSNNWPRLRGLVSSVTRRHQTKFIPDELLTDFNTILKYN